MHAAHRRRARLLEVPLRAVLADVLAELALAQELDELRAQEDADQQRGGAADENPAHSALPRARRRPARACTAAARRRLRPQRDRDALEADPARALDAARCRPSRSSAGEQLGRRPRRRPAREPRRRTPRAISAASGPTVTSSSTPRSRACSPISRCRRRLVGPELEHVAEHRDPARRGGLGEVVERGAHRHRVGVVAVVDQRPRRRAACTRCAAHRREATSSAPAGVTPERARRRHARRSRLQQVVRLRRRTAAGAISLAADARSATSPSRLARGAATRRRPSPKRDRAQVLAQVRRRAAARRPGRPTLAPGASPAISSALAAAIASSEPSSSRWAGPTLTITPTSGSAIAVSSAICPGPRIAISSTSASRVRPARRGSPAAGRSRC